MTDQSHTISGAQLKAFIERIERLEEEKKEVAEQIKEVKAEAKNAGFDVKIIGELIKIRRKPKEQHEEERALLELYADALGMKL